jgi:Protein of unknown function (DUF4241)
MSVLFRSLCLLTIMASCNNEPVETDLFPHPDKSDTSKPVIATSFHSKAYPEIFDAAFHTGTTVKQEEATYSFYALTIGKINIESGKIIACDPIVLRNAKPFSPVFQLGQFPVMLAMAKTSNDERVAFSRIVFSDSPVVRWEFALHQGQEPIPLKDTSFYCYGVDGGTGMFVDSVAAEIFDQKPRSYWDDVFLNKMEETNYTGLVDDFDGHNLAMFSTGYGDGCYATYIGFDEKRNICQLLTDFGIAEWWKLKEKK